MKYLEFNLDNTCIGVFDSPAAGRYEFDYDPAKYFLPTLQLKDGKVVHTLPGLSYKDQETTFNKAKEAADFEQNKINIIPTIKSHAAEKIRLISWKLERAKEQDELAGTTDKTLKALAERQAIRDASNAHEAKLMALKTIKELEDFDPQDF